MPAGTKRAAAATAPERKKSRREKVALLDMGLPPRLVLPLPHLLHCFRIAWNASVLRGEAQFPVYLPCHVGELEHRHREGGDGDRGVELFAFAESRDKVCEVKVCHGITADQVSGRTRIARLEFALFITLEVVDLVAIAINEHCSSRAHNGRTIEKLASCNHHVFP